MRAAVVTEDALADAIAPTLAAFVIKAEPVCRKVSETIYETLLYSVQDYLRENAEWNIGQEIARCRRIELENLTLREQNKALLEALLTQRDYVADAASGHLVYKDSGYEGSGEGFVAMAKEDLARIDAAISKARGEA